GLLENYGFGSLSGIPYHVGEEPDDNLWLFYIKQGAFRQADGTLRYCFGPTTLLSRYTSTWDLPDAVVAFAPHAPFTVHGTLDVDGMTLTSGSCPQSPSSEEPATWAGIRVTAGSTLRATGLMTIAGTTDPTLDPVPIDVEGTLAVAAGGTLMLTG